MIDTAGDVGGTWYWNRYPGVQCDVESYIYLPLLEELNYVPTERYAHGPEIREHLQNIARHYRLYDNALLGTTVTGLHWDDAAKRWQITTDRGDTCTATLVAVSPGSLTRPKLPGIPGINEFRGHTFHTSRWDFGYTGGDESGGLTKLTDKRVGVIGTGSTGLQCIPHLAEWRSSSTSSSAPRARFRCAATAPPTPLGGRPQTGLATRTHGELHPRHLRSGDGARPHR